MRRTVTFNISAQAMQVIADSDLFKHPARYNPGCQDTKEASEALRYPDVIRRGQGHTNIVVMSPGAARIVMEYCDTSGRTLKLDRDLAVRTDGNALLVVADRIMWKLKELS